MACTVAKPIVDGIEAQYAGQLLVLRVDMQDAAGKELSSEYTARVTPTFIFFDGTGSEVWRSMGTLDPQQVASSLK